MSETVLLEQYLTGSLAPENQLLMDARLLLDKELQDKAAWQQQAYALVTAYGRNCLKQDIEAAQKKVFSEKRFAGFRKKVSSIFR